MEEKLKKYQKSVLRHKDKIWTPEKADFINETTNSWFDIQDYNNNLNTKCNVKISRPKNKSFIKAIKVNLHPTKIQKQILKTWFNSCTLMYNKTLYFIKKNYKETGKLNIDHKNIRTYHLKEERDKIINGIPENKIYVHIMDQVIKLACTNYKSALSNLKNKKIKHFRIRYWKTNRKNKILEIEPSYFSNNSLCYYKLGLLKSTYNNKPFDLGLLKTKYKKSCKLVYNNGQYFLMVPEEVLVTQEDNRKNTISLDPGTRTFLTGISDDSVTKISSSQERIKILLKKIDRYNNNNNVPKKIKRNNESRCNRKIKNLVDDLHWKTIKFLTARHENILIGDIETKRITSNEKSVLRDMTKRITYKLSFYKFKTRLEYKCKATNTGFKKIDECYTSKVCSSCSYLKKDLGASKIFSCNNCNLVIDRDVNGARGIFIKAQ